jgi:basic membrane lipoprotein Med (substrate-binding protein (PBP1-ABC) superfamily)
LAVLLLAVVLLPTASAQAATVSQKVYKIFVKEYHAELAYSKTQMQANLTAAQKKLAATASSIDALSSSNTTAATALVDELESQYDAAGARGLFTATLTAFTALSKVALTHTEHKAVVADEASVKRILTINTPADLARWQAAGFATAKEPSNTKRFGGIVGISLPSIALSITASSSAIKAFNKLQKQASTKTTKVFNTLSNDWATWASGFGIEAG